MVWPLCGLPLFILMTISYNICENDDPCMLAIVWPTFDDYDDSELNV